MSRHSASKRGHKNPFKGNRSQPRVERLEDRSLMTANTISGYVFFDANTNGLFDAGEAPIANSQIQLHTLAGVVVGSTTTNAAGYYEFSKDQSIPKIDKVLTKTVTFPKTQTNFQLQGLLEQFNPALGTLESIEIKHAGTITSEIQVENFSTDSDSDISGTVSGTLTLVAPGVNDVLNISGNAGMFSAAVYDGVTDFAGTSGKSFGQKNATGNQTFLLTGNAINAYIGTGTVNVSEKGVATSSANGGGNLDVRIRSTGESTVTVTYRYKEFGPLDPGSYKVVQVVQPPTFTDGLESKTGLVIPQTIGTDFIIVGLLDQDLPNNNFGELKTTSLSGHVWHDADNDGVRDAGEDPIAGAIITLEGPSGPMQKTTDAAGYYEFNNLLAGTYTVKETQPTNYLDGKDNAGTKGGTVVNNALMDQIQTIVLAPGDDSQNNDFGELKPASIAGHVYFDANNNGIFEMGELPIAGATVTLTGTDDLGNPIAANTSMLTNALGEYKFTNLRPGTYVVSETQPVGYLDGKDTIGTPGGTTSNDAFSAIVLPVGFDGVNNDFGEIKPASIAGHVYFDANNNGIFDMGELPIAGATVTLTGIDDRGFQNPINTSMQTNALGQYKFINLRPGTYALTETQPIGYLDGKDTIGTPGGATNNDAFSAIALPAGFDGVNNDFGEIRSNPPVPGNPIPKANPPLPNMPIFTKNQLLVFPTLVNVDPVFRGQMAFVVGTTFTLTGKTLNLDETLAEVEKLRAGMSQGAFVNQLWTSNAHRAMQAKALYQEVLHRAPTAQEKAQTIAQLKAGADELTIRESLFVSPEYQQLHPSSQALATGLYQDILNKTPGSLDLQTLVQTMANDPLQNVVNGLLNSDESLANLIDDAYRATVRRPARAAEIQSWTAQLKAGATTLDVIATRLLTSQEFYQLAYNKIV